MKVIKEEKTEEPQRPASARGKPENYWELCQAVESHDDTDFDDFETEMQTIAMESSPSEEKNKVEHKAAVARKAIERERPNRMHSQLLLGEAELPDVLRTLARVFDFKNCRLLDTPLEATVKPWAPVPKLQPSKVREVPIVPLELETMVVDHPYSQHKHEHQLEENHPYQLHQFQSSSHHASIQSQYHTYAYAQHPSFLYPHHYPPHHMHHFPAPYPSPPLPYAMRVVESHRFGHESHSRFLPASANSDHAQHSMPNGSLIRFHSRLTSRHRQPPYVPPPRQLPPHRGSLYAPQRQSLHTPIPSGARSIRRPIIVVPDEFTSLITLHNVQPLLQEQRFVPPAIMRRSELRTLDEVSIVRNFRGEKQHYRVIDNVARLTADDWDQVVAVFVSNPHQQFIGWPNHGDPAIICRHLCAFHLHYKGKAIYRELESLWLNVLSIPEQDRSRDGEILKEFWWKLDQHMANNDRPMGFARQS